MMTDFDLEKLSLQNLSKIIGISRPTLYSMKKVGAIVEDSDGKFSIRKTVKGLINFYKGGGNKADGGKPGSKKNERERLTIAQRRQIELSISERRKELINLGEVQQFMDETIVMLIGQLDGLPGRMASELAGIDDPAQIRKTLFEETRRVRNGIAENFEAYANGQALSEAVEDSASTNG